MHAGIEHRHQQIDQLRPIAAESLREHVGAQQQHGARLGLRQRIAHSGRMTPHQVGLQLRQALVWNANIRQLAEARVHAVYSLACIEDFFDGCPACGHARSRLGRNLDPAVVQRDRLDFGQESATGH